MLIELHEGIYWSLIFNDIRNFIKMLGREISVIAWILIVFVLIFWSYLQNDLEISKRAEINTYEKLSVLQEYK